MVKDQTPIRKIFYVEKVQFLRSMMEVALKALGAEIYTIDTMVNNFYLLDDLKPDLIIFDLQTVGDSLDQVISYKEKAILVAIGTPEEVSKLEGRVNHFLTKPIEAAISDGAFYPFLTSFIDNHFFHRFLHRERELK